MSVRPLHAAAAATTDAPSRLAAVLRAGMQLDEAGDEGDVVATDRSAKNSQIYMAHSHVITVKGQPLQDERLALIPFQRKSQEAGVWHDDIDDGTLLFITKGGQLRYADSYMRYVKAVLSQRDTGHNLSELPSITYQMPIKTSNDDYAAEARRYFNTLLRIKNTQRDDYTYDHDAPYSKIYVFFKVSKTQSFFFGRFAVEGVVDARAPRYGDPFRASQPDSTVSVVLKPFEAAKTFGYELKQYVPPSQPRNYNESLNAMIQTLSSNRSTLRSVLDEIARGSSGAATLSPGGSSPSASPEPSPRVATPKLDPLAAARARAAASAAADERAAQEAREKAAAQQAAAERARLAVVMPKRQSSLQEREKLLQLKKARSALEEGGIDDKGPLTPRPPPQRQPQPKPPLPPLGSIDFS